MVQETRSAIPASPIERCIRVYSNIGAVGKIVEVRCGEIRRILIVVSEGIPIMDKINGIQEAISSTIRVYDEREPELASLIRPVFNPEYQEVLEKRDKVEDPKIEVRVLWERPREAANPPQA